MSRGKPRNRFFQTRLTASRGTAPEARTDFRPGVYEQIRQVGGQQGELTVERMCTLAAVSRASYYRHLGPQPADDEEESRLRDDRRRIALANRHYGYRRITHALRAQGWEINHKRVARLMRSDNLLAIRKRRFAPVTTDSKHDLEVSINVARRLTPAAINQLWVARHHPTCASAGSTCFWQLFWTRSHAKSSAGRSRHRSRQPGNSNLQEQFLAVHPEKDEPVHEQNGDTLHQQVQPFPE